MKNYRAYLAGFMIFFVILIVFFGINAVDIRNLNKKIDERTRELEVLINENKELRTRYESIVSRERIVRIATAQLGMTIPDEGAVVIEIPAEKLRNEEEN